MASETPGTPAGGATAGAPGRGRRVEQAGDVEAMGALGERLGRGCAGGGVVYLVGDLGTGKTTLVRGMLRGLGHRGSVRSPTFTLVEPYALAALDAYHLDLYRLGDPEELEYLGLRDYLEPGVLCLVEWPERGLGHLPPSDLTVRIEYADDGRRIELTAETPAGQRILDQISISA